MSSDFFYGNALNGIDAKGRLSIPADYRGVIERRSKESAVLIGLHERADCLIGYDLDRVARLHDEVAARFGNEQSEARDSALRTLFGSPRKAAFDGTGRIVLPEDLRAIAGIGDVAFFYAVGDLFEIWNPDMFLATPGLDPRIARLVRRQLDARGAA